MAHGLYVRTSYLPTLPGCSSPVMVEHGGKITPPPCCENNGQLVDHSEIRPNFDVYVSLLRCHSQAMNSSDGKFVHAHIIKYRYDTRTFIRNLLIDMYGKCGNIDEAKHVFDGTCKKNLYSWTLMMNAYMVHGQLKRAVYHFRQMQSEVEMPDKVMISTIISACSSYGYFEEGKLLHAFIAGKEIECHTVVGTALINLYGNFSRVEEAHRVFNTILVRDIISWNAIIGSYFQNGFRKSAIECFIQMQLEGYFPNEATLVTILGSCSNDTSLPEGKRIHSYVICNTMESSVVTRTAIINMYSKSGSLEDAWKTFERIGVEDRILWTLMVGALAQSGLSKDAIQLAQKMQLEGLEMDRVTVINVLYACSSFHHLAEGKRIHAYFMARDFILDVTVGNSLLAMYLKCGSIFSACMIFNAMFEQDIISWTTMITGYVQYGYPDIPVGLFQKMQLIHQLPDMQNLISMLYACGRMKCLAVGKYIHCYILCNYMEEDVSLGNTLVHMYGMCGSFEGASREFQIMEKWTVPSWTIMVAMYTQNGYVKGAIRLFRQMQNEGFMPDKAIFITILDALACSSAHIVEGKLIHKAIVTCGIELDVAIGTSLLNMYARCGSIEDAFAMFNKLRNQDATLLCSMVAAYANNGHEMEAINVFQRMHAGGIVLDKVTITSFLSACSRAGLLNEGCHWFVSMSKDIYIAQVEEHYNCIISILGRSGKLDEVYDFVKSMSINTSPMSATAFLSAVKVHGEKQGAQYSLEPDSGEVHLIYNYPTSITL